MTSLPPSPKVLFLAHIALLYTNFLEHVKHPSSFIPAASVSNMFLPERALLQVFCHMLQEHQTFY